MLDYRLDSLAAVAHVVIFEFFDIREIDGLAHFLFPKFLTREVVQPRDRRSICERGAVSEARGDDWRCWEAVDDAVRDARDSAILGVSEHECEMAMSSSPACCFDGCRNFRELLLEMVYGGGRWLADNPVKRQWCDDGSYGLVDRSFIRGWCGHFVGKLWLMCTKNWLIVGEKN